MPIHTQRPQSHYTIRLNMLDQTRAPEAGGKAAALARLSQAGSPVPDGFCILASAYDLAAQGRDTTIDVIPEPVRAEIAAAYDALIGGQDGPVAVRSSASGEDGARASYAGQFLSVLDVRGLDGVYRAVLDCWNSARGAHARAYAGALDGSSTARMALIVQRMVPAELSGVLFTANPSTGNRSRMVVEIAHGVHGAVEQGSLTPARLVLDGRSGRIDRRFSSGVDSLKDSRLPFKSLARAGRRIEALFGSPQDIEWTLAGDRLWILQSRPVTSLPVVREVWSRANAGEILPGVVTPLSWSVFQPVLRRAGWHSGRFPLTLHWRWQHPAGSWPDSPRLFDGRAYMELRSVYASFAGFPGVDAGVLRSVLGFEFNLLDPQELPQRRPRWHPLDIYRWARYWAEMLGVTRALPAAQRRLNANRARLLAQDFSQMDAPALLRRSAALQEQAARALGLHITCTALAFSAYGLLRRLRRRLPPEALQKLEKRLTAGAQEMSTLRHMRAIENLARAVNACTDARAILLEYPLADVPEQWRGRPAAAGVTRQWDAFLRDFGSRGTQEFELAVPRWEEDPGVVLATLREAILREQPSSKPELPETTREIRSAGWLARRFFAAYARLVPLRENLKHDVSSHFHALRKVYLRLGEILVQTGNLSCPQDVFFLEQTDLWAYLGKNIRYDLAALVATRKTAQTTDMSIDPAPVFMRSGDAITPLTTPDAGGDVLRGIGCSAGNVTAPAAVLRALDGSQRVPGGCILVAPSIDPGLTPLLLNAAGLVTEVGGMLSHGATLAREFGIPAVVSVPGITRAVQDGQIISLDGTAGRVILIPGAQGDQP